MTPVLSSADTSVERVIRELASHGLAAAFLVPTATGLAKSIMDAHQSVREYLRDRGIHDFDKQSQGQEHKVVLAANLVYVDRVESRRLTLYRPKTKTGDPRIWVERLNNYAKPSNLLVVLAVTPTDIFIINCSQIDIWNSLKDPTSPLGRLVLSPKQSSAADELLHRLRDISAMGFVPSLRKGDTGVGFTLESLLGISANASKKPDFKGIELKSGRRKSGSGHRSTLFSQVPSWEQSKSQSTKEILLRHGYRDNARGRLSLNCTLSASPNSQGLFLQVSSSGEYVEAMKFLPSSAPEAVVVWPLRALRERLSNKHRETFWVKAKSKIIRAKEHFHYIEVIHTQRPLVDNFAPLIDVGKIEVDFLMHIKSNGSARDHGYLFKISPSNLDLLFPAPKTYNLTI